jgi:hypothetical protein
MSFLCCEDAGVYTSICESFDVPEGTITPTGIAPFHIDLRRSPFRQMCLSVVIPLTLQVSAETVVTVIVTLYRGRSTSQADIVKVTPNFLQTVAAPTAQLNLFTTMTPALLHKVPPGEYTILVVVSPSNAATVSVVSGQVNASAVLSQLTL